MDKNNKRKYLKRIKLYRKALVKLKNEVHKFGCRLKIKKNTLFSTYHYIKLSTLWQYGILPI